MSYPSLRAGEQAVSAAGPSQRSGKGRTEYERRVGFFKARDVPEITSLSEAVAVHPRRIPEVSPSTFEKKPPRGASRTDSQDVLRHVLDLSARNDDDRVALQPVHQLPSPLLVLLCRDARRELAGCEEVRVSRGKRLAVCLCRTVRLEGCMVSVRV